MHCMFNNNILKSDESLHLLSKKTSKHISPIEEWPHRSHQNMAEIIVLVFWWLFIINRNQCCCVGTYIKWKTFDKPLLFIIVVFWRRKLNSFHNWGMCCLAYGRKASFVPFLVVLVVFYLFIQYYQNLSFKVYYVHVQYTSSCNYT